MQHDFKPAWWLPGPHLPTLWGKFARRGRPLPIHLERWTTPDDDFVDLVRLPAPGPTRPRLLLLHGLEGGPRSHYVHGLFTQAASRGWGMELLIFRGCGAEPNRAPRFYHSGDTQDLAFVLERLHDEAPDAPRLLAGVSLGGNVLLKYLGERGEDVDPSIVAAATVSVPYDLARGSRKVGRGFSRIYERHFLQSLRRKALSKLLEHPGLFDAERLGSARTLWDFDDVVTAPVHGFASAADYYAQSSSLGYLGGIRRPTLLLSAVDDPFLPSDVLDEVRETVLDNPAVELHFEERGGHVGFVGGTLPWQPYYFAEHRVADFLSRRLGDAASDSESFAGTGEAGTA